MADTQAPPASPGTPLRALWSEFLKESSLREKAHAGGHRLRPSDRSGVASSRRRECANFSGGHPIDRPAIRFATDLRI
jgi:hypothetical protein